MYIYVYVYIVSLHVYRLCFSTLPYVSWISLSRTETRIRLRLDCVYKKLVLPTKSQLHGFSYRCIQYIYSRFRFFPNGFNLGSSQIFFFSNQNKVFSPILNEETRFGRAEGIDRSSLIDNTCLCCP